jgi:hypothetical protein
MHTLRERTTLNILWDQTLLQICPQGKAVALLDSSLETYEISQNRLAVLMGTGRSNVHRWVAEVADPVGDSILEIRDALKTIHPEAAEEFKRLYWDEAIENQE